MRRSFSSALFGLVMMLASAPAHSAENLNCVTRSIDRKLSDKLFKTYRTDQELGDVLIAQIGDKVAACAAAHDWSKEALESAFRVVFGQVLVRGVLAEIKAFRIDPAALQASTDKYLASLPREKLRLFVDGALSDEEGGEIVNQLIGDEVVRLSKIDEKLGGLIGEYAAGRANETFFSTEFASQ